jgi:hypothetical protein
MIDISTEVFVRHMEPLYKELHPYAQLFFVLILGFWVVKKIEARALKDGGSKEPAKEIIIKVVIFFFFIMLWQPFFMAVFYLNDAMEARILEVHNPELRSTDSIMTMDIIIHDLYYDLTNAAIDGKNSARTDDLETGSESNSLTERIFNPIKSAVSGMTTSIFTIPKAIFVANAGGVVGFIAALIKTTMLLVRIIFSGFFYVCIPFFILFSYMPVLGSQDGKDGALNQYSKKIINVFVNMALWPTMYAVVDKIFLSVYAILSESQMLFSYTNISAFMLTYIITIITAVVVVHNANPYAVMHGVLNAFQSVAQVSAMGMMASKGAVSKMAGGKISSNSSLAGGSE